MPKKKSTHVLVTGGCGYIGSHVTRLLTQSGYTVIVLDDLSTGFADSLLHGEQLYVGNCGDKALVQKILTEHEIQAVLHFAASISVPESVAKPLNYYRNNTLNTVSLLECMVDRGVKNIIFSSTAAIYGEAQEVVTEDTPPAPTNPYGWSKLFDEQIVKDVHLSGALNYVILRYFNVAGASLDGKLGQRSKDATHLFKIASQVATSKRDKLLIYGNTYATKDGTGVRDYIHVEDLAAAHALALDHLLKGGESQLLNCGYGHGYSVLEIIAAFEKVLGRALPYELTDKRPGDVSALVANVEKIKKILNWQAQHAELAKIVESVVRWEECSDMSN